MAMAVEGVKRERGTIPVGSYSFHREYRDHPGFLVSVKDSDGVFGAKVPAWGNMIDFIGNLMIPFADPRTVQRVKRDIFMTGYAGVADINIRVTPLS
ncbi:hypothetical protein [Streptomyces sp. 4F14]|uniref:hypothetical protein n=1 Tax=Streptomyces sp. 4F14 TaxID=3394380 RepID=UPI003A8429FC